MGPCYTRIALFGASLPSPPSRSRARSVPLPRSSKTPALLCACRRRCPHSLGSDYSSIRQLPASSPFTDAYRRCSRRAHLRIGCQTD
ncbi:hypothetical protein PYCCODRAFT_57384 [Trametes coccinea BRFM310]|uniref:Uncharacterized protein n=1 Tax=Trametes coccinea (strain BRFM310) TaxID=1353009 RepID=A0A1Y2J7J7_TRAC3|nr:hypothetical protein PYCCODRAFT_57384 [Trametes coccinea BRFM310]